ncbi:SPW repeat protein [Devosia salina]|uniref:SPW repeat protein n=1 Tax=Devosia salina TaxID=2860336 RepID=A0ABX8WGX6_9HYPH|nr:SPW repeat protein [Devosia salina]QYO75545.1 SPW repeat protein [Devosia salina]
MLKSLSSNNRTVLNIVSIVAGLGLLFSPWYLGYADQANAAWNAWINGAGVSLIAAAALLAFHEAEEWANLVLAAWAVVAPWILGFAAATAATTVHVVAGLVVAALAGLSLWFTHNRPLSTA